MPIFSHVPKGEIRNGAGAGQPAGQAFLNIVSRFSSGRRQKARPVRHAA